MSDASEERPSLSSEEIIESIRATSSRHEADERLGPVERRRADLETAVQNLTFYADRLRSEGKLGKALEAIRGVHPEEHEYLASLLGMMVKKGAFSEDEVGLEEKE